MATCKCKDFKSRIAQTDSALDHIIKKLPLNIPYNSRSGRGMMDKARRQEIEDYTKVCSIYFTKELINELLTEIDRLNKQLEQFRLHGLGEK